MEQEAADELVGGEGHDLLAVGTAAAIVLVAERDAAFVEAEEPAVRDGDAVGVARQVGEHRLGTGERRLSVGEVTEIRLFIVAVPSSRLRFVKRLRRWSRWHP